MGCASRAAATAPRHRLARLVPYSTPATQRTTAESGSRHFYKGSLAARWLEVASGGLFSVPEHGLDRAFSRMQHPARAGWLGLFDHLAGDREQRRRHGESGRLGCASFNDRLGCGRLRLGQASQPARAENSFRFQLSFQNVAQRFNSGSAFRAFPRRFLGVFPTIVLADGV